MALAGAGLVNFGAGAAPRTMSLNPLRGVMRAFLEALILMASPVAGLRPMRALVWICANLAKPVSTTGSPLATVAQTTSVKLAARRRRFSVRRRWCLPTWLTWFGFFCPALRCGAPGWPAASSASANSSCARESPLSSDTAFRSGAIAWCGFPNC